jgi:hypothetical protein
MLDHQHLVLPPANTAFHSFFLPFFFNNQTMGEFRQIQLQRWTRHTGRASRSLVQGRCKGMANALVHSSTLQSRRSRVRPFSSSSFHAYTHARTHALIRHASSVFPPLFLSLPPYNSLPRPQCLCVKLNTFTATTFYCVTPRQASVAKRRSARGRRRGRGGWTMVAWSVEQRRSGRAVERRRRRHLLGSEHCM